MMYIFAAVINRILHASLLPSKEKNIKQGCEKFFLSPLLIDTIFRGNADPLPKLL
jgi:hypothetical protein